MAKALPSKLDMARVEFRRIDPFGVRADGSN